MSRTAPLSAAVLLALLSGQVFAAAVILPQGRSAFYSKEPMEISVVDLAKGADAAVELLPKDASLHSVRFEVVGDGGAVTVVVPAGTLAPGEYSVQLDGKPAVAKLIIAAGVSNSTMLASHTGADLVKGGGNFVVGCMAGTGLLDAGATLARRKGHSSTLQTFDAAIARDLPTVMYMYWTGFIVHKPWGRDKSWENAAESEAMRLFNFRAGQVARRYASNFVTFGTLDEPGLNWGKNANGVWCGGIANWDGAPWYAQRGWKFTTDPAARDDADWMKYMSIRTSIIGEHQAQARKDIEASWPGVPFSADCYAVHIVTDGADAMSQLPNKIPCTHVFVDWGVPRAAAGSEIYIEKSCDPTAPVAHAMNGRLFGGAIPTEQSVSMYHLTMNAMLQAGLFSNWWLNPTDMKAPDIAPVNEAAQRVGPLFREVSPARHDVAVLWSFTELCMREKDIVAKQAKQTTGAEPIKLMVAALPENNAMSQGEVVVSAYNVAQNYRYQVSHAHAAILRAGYPAHVVHEKVLAKLLHNYKVLVVVGQTFPLPPDVTAAIEAWQAQGGKVVADKTTTHAFKDAVTVDAGLQDIGFRWGAMFGAADKIVAQTSGGYKNDSPFKTVKEGSKYQTNWWVGEFARQAVAPLKAALAQTAAAPVMETGQVNLIAERHVAGQAMLYMILNANDVLPEIPDDQKYLLYNYAPLKASFTLKGIPNGSAVYCIEGIDWKQASQVPDYGKPIAADFAAGEMKLYLAVPHAPKGIALTAKAAGGQIAVLAQLADLQAPWPITVTLTGPDGKDLYKVYRSMDANGAYAEIFPVGTNVSAGQYKLAISSPLAGLTASAVVDIAPAGAFAPAVIADTVRVFDEKAIRDFLAAKPEVVIAAGERDKAAAEQLAKGLAAHGVKAVVGDSKTILQKVLYPRIWNPYVGSVKPGGEAKQADGDVKAKLTVQLADDGNVQAIDSNGLSVKGDWRKPGTLVTVGPKGMLVWCNEGSETAYEAGCELYVNKSRRLDMLNCVKTEVNATEEFKTKWARPWTELTVYGGGYQLPPELPEAYTTAQHLILLGDSNTSAPVAALQASEILTQVVDAQYPGPGKALLQFAWSPFAVEKNVIFVGATDAPGVKAGVAKLLDLLAK